MNNGTKDSIRVLVVEDEPDFAALISSVLSKHGYDVTLAWSANEAVEKLEEEDPDLITLDLQMPGKSGLHFYRQIKSSSAHRNVPVIVITGVTHGDRDMTNFVRSFLEVDHLPAPQAYIEKPFDNQELADVVDRVLTPRDHQQQ